jgi:hypothetical protein
MGFLEKITQFFSDNKIIESSESPKEIFDTQYDKSYQNNSLDHPDDKRDVNIIGVGDEVEGRFFDDLIKPTEEENFRRDQHKIINKLRAAHIPEYAVCSVSGCKRKKDTPLFIGQDGKYYCRDHILPENSGRPATGKPPFEGHG